MKVKHLMLSSVLAIPALLLPLASCDDSKAPTEPTVTNPTDQVDAPSFTTVGFGSFWHDPHIKGQKIRTFSGTADGGGCTGETKRFKSEDGAEVRTTAGCSYAGIYPADQKLRGRLLSRVSELDFSYAGGTAAGGSPRWSIPIDCETNNQNGDAIGTAACYPDGKTDTYPDGVTEKYAFADNLGCNDGDTNVGVVNGEDQANCAWFYSGVVYPNWAAFAAAYPGAKVARKNFDGTADAFYFVIVDQGPAHYLLFKVDAR